MRSEGARVAGFALLIAASVAEPARAQDPTRTIGQLLDTLIAGAALVDFAHTEPELNARLDSLSDCFASGGTRSLTLQQAASLFDPAARRDVPPARTNVTTIARWYRSQCGTTSRDSLYSAVVSLNKIANGTLRGLLRDSTRRWVDAF